MKIVTEPSPIIENTTEERIISKKVGKSVLTNIFVLISWNIATDMLKKSRAGRMYLPKRIAIYEAVFRISEEFKISLGTTKVVIIPSAQPIKYIEKVFRFFIRRRIP